MRSAAFMVGRLHPPPSPPLRLCVVISMACFVHPAIAASFCPRGRSLRFCDLLKRKVMAGLSCKRTRRIVFGPLATASIAADASDNENSYAKVLNMARMKFIEEISFAKKDTDVSLAKALLFIAAEDEAFVSFNRELDACSFSNERENTSSPVFWSACSWNGVEDMPMAGKNISGWLGELDLIAKEVEVVSRDIGCQPLQVLEAVNSILFESRGFKRLPVMVDSKVSYLHHALKSGSSSAIILSVIYMEICQRLSINMVGSQVGEDPLIWPNIYNLEELFKGPSGHSLFAVINGACVQDPRTKAYDLDSKSLLGLEKVINRDVIGIALANLIRLHWKQASSKACGLTLSSPLRVGDMKGFWPPLLRPQE